MSNSRPRILLVDDDLALVETLTDGLLDLGYDAVGVASSGDAVKRMSEPFDAVVTDLRMPGVDGMGMLAASRRAAPDRPVILMTAYSAVDTAIESIRQGAYHYLTKPFKVDELALFLGRALGEARLRRETRALRKTVREGLSLDNVMGSSAGMRDVCNLVRRVADADVPVLILGETGTGKGLIARAIHAEGRRAEHAFVTVSCAALPENLLESELFGHAKGAFTGATVDRRGLLEEAEGGTVFLDEIGEMPIALQTKLLDVLERGVIRPVGSNKERAIDVRIVAATHRDLEARVKSGQFREDLLFRLDVVTTEIPPLRHRTGDIPELAMHFLELARRKNPKSPVVRPGKDALDAMVSYSWPGNVRELEHVIERAVLLGSSPEVGVTDLPRALTTRGTSKAPEFAGPVVPLADIERRYAAWALEQMGGRKMATAEKLDVDRKTLARLLGDPDKT
jgi:two-component system response regulator HydG